MAGVDHQWTETLQLTLTAGAHYTKSKFPKTEVVFVPPASIATTTSTMKQDNSGFILNGILNWRLEPITLSASVSRDVAPSIYGEVMTGDRVSTVLGYRLSEKLRCTLSTGYYHSETEGFVQEGKWQTYSVRPSLTYSFTEDINLQLGYAYTRTENEITDDSEDQNRFFVELSTAWPSTIE
jgi:outer membrane receptor protein involved in Fe transport